MVPRGRIVVVEDPLIVPLLRAALQGGGYQVIAASSVEEAAKRTEEEAGRIDLLIIAAEMPGASEFTAALRKRYPGLQVLLTCTSAYDECPFYEGGCLGLPCLRKPLDMMRDRLLERVAAHLR